MPPATDQVQHLKEPVVAQAWLKLSVRKTKSKEERGSIMSEHHTPKTGEGSPSGLDHAA